MYTVLGNIKSRSFRAYWMLEEIGVPYVSELLSPRDPKVKSYNPSGKVPVLLDGDEAISDSSAILTYLADKHGQLTHPAGTIQRAKQDSMTFAINDDIDALLWTAARHSFILPPEHRVPEIKPPLRYEFSRNCHMLTKKIGGSEFVTGDQMTIPDILLTHNLRWAKSAKFPTNSTFLDDYLERMNERPALKRVEAMASNSS
jgi:glutathione S-transferase